MNKTKPVTDIRPGDSAFLTGRKYATVERVERTADRRFVIHLDNGMKLGPMTDAYSVEVAA